MDVSYPLRWVTFVLVLEQVLQIIIITYGVVILRVFILTTIRGWSTVVTGIILTVAGTLHLVKNHSQ